MIGQRIRELRKACGLTQQEFADRLNVKRNTITSYEIGRSKPIDAVINLICLEFGCQEEWLRDGKGEMFRELTRGEELAGEFGRFLRDEQPEFRAQTLLALLRMSDNAWNELEALVRRLAAVPPLSDPHDSE